MSGVNFGCFMMVMSSCFLQNCDEFLPRCGKTIVWVAYLFRIHSMSQRVLIRVAEQPVSESLWVTGGVDGPYVAYYRCV